MLPNNVLIHSCLTGEWRKLKTAIDNIFVTKGKIEVFCQDGTYFYIEDSSISPKKIIKHCKNSNCNLSMMVFQTFMNGLTLDRGTDMGSMHPGKYVTVLNDHMVEGAFEEYTFFTFSDYVIKGMKKIDA